MKASLTNTEVRKDAIQDPFVIDPAGDLAERMQRAPEITGEQFGRTLF